MFKCEVIERYKIEQEEIKRLLTEGLFVEAEYKLDNSEIKNETYYSLYSNYYYLTNNCEAGIALLEKAMKEIPFSFEITYNLATLKSVVGDFFDSMYLFAKCGRIATSQSEKEDAINQVEQIIKEFNKYTNFSSEGILESAKLVKKVLVENDERNYPINRFNESLVKRTVENREGEAYLTEMYKSMFIEDVDNNSRYFFKNEILSGKVTKSYAFAIEDKTTVPIAFFEDYDDVFVEGPNSSYVFPKNTLMKNQYNYYTFSDKGEYKIFSEKEFFIAKPINLNPPKKPAQIVISIFIDGLANTVIENDLKELMPNTYKFFSKGYRNNNCYTSGDWTLPSVSSIYTGKTTINHGLYHPTYHYELNRYNQLFPEYFREKGYLTAQINNDWRVTPTSGYIQGMDRILYQNSNGGFWAGEVIAETIEHLETFKDNNHFLWVSLMDLHDVADEINNDLMSQVHLSSKYRQSKNLGPTSVLSKYDRNKIEKYNVELRRIDLHLSNLFNYLEKNFGMDNIIVSLISDHGQTYLKHDEFLLQEPKRKVPFMLVGRDIEKKVSDELCSIIDFFPTIAKLADVSVDSQEGAVLKDFGGEGRDFALTETLHPNQPYLVAITDNEYIFRFKTTSNVTENTLIDLEYYDAQLLDLKTLNDVSDLFPDKLEHYCKMVVQRAMKLQI